MKEKPQAGKVVKTEQGVFGSTILTLSNGVRVILKPTDFKADEVRMQAFSPGGTSLFNDKDVLQFALISQIASLGGLGNFNSVDLDKVLAGKMASASAMVNTYSEGLSGSLLSERLGNHAAADLPALHCTAYGPGSLHFFHHT